MKNSFYALAYAVAVMLSTGFLFKLMHWPGASILLILGVVLLNVAVLPMWFFGKKRGA